MVLHLAEQKDLIMKSLKLLCIIALGIAVAPAGLASAQLPSCSVKDPNTGADCVSSTFLSRSSNSTGYSIRYRFTNTCDRAFTLTMDTGAGQTREREYWVGRATSSGPREQVYICISGYNGAGDCQNISWSYDC